jgi:hypothetical protein
MKSICYVFVLVLFLVCGCGVQQAQASIKQTPEIPETPTLDSISDERIKNAIAAVCTGNGDPIKNIFYGNTDLISIYSDACLLEFEAQFANHHRWPGPLDNEGRDVAHKIVLNLNGYNVPSFIVYEREAPEDLKDIGLLIIDAQGYTGGRVLSLIMETMCNQRESLYEQGVFIDVPSGTPPCTEQ